ncbi:hypothetical protein BB561_000798 [Smittium simulii]|uniref:Uncharacterized protein n=1 Tax=Smittium simulii TaxID=133385 RepID=A0A2T9YXI1_9FUNG|nr:hypothetical protein BB561_000798 [Smittium simulii]
MKLAFFSTFSAISFQVVALFGSVFLTVMGYLFKSKAEEFTGSTHDPIDTDAVGNACYSAALTLILALYTSVFSLLISGTETYFCSNTSRLQQTSIHRRTGLLCDISDI